MSWWLRDKVAGAIEFAAAILIGYALTFLVALVRSRRRAVQDSRMSIGQFVRLNGFDTSMVALIAIPTAGFAGLIYGGLLALFLDKVLDVSLDRELRFAIVGLAGASVYVGCLVYIVLKLLKDKETSERSGT